MYEEASDGARENSSVREFITGVKPSAGLSMGGVSGRPPPPPLKAPKVKPGVAGSGYGLVVAELCLLLLLLL